MRATKIQKLQKKIRVYEKVLEEYHALVADLAANLPEFEGCERPLKIGDGWAIKKRMIELEEALDNEFMLRRDLQSKILKVTSKVSNDELTDIVAEIDEENKILTNLINEVQNGN